MHSTPTWMCWKAMKQRCLNKANSNFSNYGGRGIKVCDRWLRSFENFLADMGERPDGLSIDRINNDGNYERGNCRWATSKEQVQNTRPMLRVSRNLPEIRARLATGEPRVSIARSLGIDASTISRIATGSRHG